MKYRYLTIYSVCLPVETPNSAVSEAGVCVHTGTPPFPSLPYLFGFQKICPVYQFDILPFLLGLIRIFPLMDNTVKLYYIVFDLKNNCKASNP